MRSIQNFLDLFDGKDLEKYGNTNDQFCLDLHSPFKSSAARRKVSKEFQFTLDVDVHTLQQHTEVYRLSIEPATPHILEKWDTICEFIKFLVENDKKAPKSIIYNRTSAILTGIVKENSKARLEF